MYYLKDASGATFIPTAEGVKVTRDYHADFLSAGTFTWNCPFGVESIDVEVAGAGGGYGWNCDCDCDCDCGGDDS